jgi:hypothetical protein
MLLIYRANNIIDLITIIQHSRNKGASKFSYRQLADKLGYRSPRTLAMVHKGQRLPNQNLVRKLINRFEFSPHEIELIFLFVEKAYAEKKGSPLEDIDKKITKLKTFLENNKPSQSSAYSEEIILNLKPEDLQHLLKEVENFITELRVRYFGSNLEELSNADGKIQIKLHLNLENAQSAQAVRSL